MGSSRKTQGLKLQLGSASESPQTFTDIANVTGVTGLGSGTATEIDTTDFDSVRKEFVRGLSDSGTVNVTLKWDSDAATAQTLWSLNRDGTTREWRIVESGGAYYEFDAFISQLSLDFALDSIVQASMSLRATGDTEMV